jgi:hypothetical protein
MRSASGALAAATSASTLANRLMPVLLMGFLLH